MKKPIVTTEREQVSPPFIQKISDDMIFVPSERYTVSCGTVCVDPQTNRVLILYNRRLGIWQLPKGRKNINEDLHEAALRETYEETGVHAFLLPLKVRTRSTRPHVPAANAGVIQAPAAGPREENETKPNGPAHTGEQPDKQQQRASGQRHGRDGTEAEADGGAMDDPKVACDLINNEYIGIVQYPDLQAATPNTVKTVFFFAAWADSTAPMGPGAQEEHEDLYAEWVDFSEADQRLRFEPEKEAMWKVKRDMAHTDMPYPLHA